MLTSHPATSDMFALAQGEAAGGLCRNRFWLTVFAHPPPAHFPSKKADAKDASTPWGANARKEIPFRIWASSIPKMRKASMPERYSCLSKAHSDQGAQREFFLFDTEWVKCDCSLLLIFFQPSPSWPLQTKGWITICDLFKPHPPKSICKRWVYSSVSMCKSYLVDIHSWISTTGFLSGTGSSIPLSQYSKLVIQSMSQ